MIAPLYLRRALGRFATGVAIVTCGDDSGVRVGVTINSFSALSLEPPLVLWSLRTLSPSLGAFVNARHFAINVLAHHQHALSRRFASPVADKFGEGVWHTGEGGVPVLNEAAAIFECEMASQQEAGDHVLFIGQVLKAVDGEFAPLVFHGGRYHRLGDPL